MRLLLVLLLVVVSLRAEVVLAPLFQDHVILQREKPVPVWGMADPKERVTVQFRGQTISCRARADGRWIVYLAPLEASASPGELVVTGRNTVRVADVLVGDVWLCSGQSNMEWPVSKSQDAAAEIAAATLPQIRHFKVERTVAGAPAATVKGAWAVCSPATAGDFTAVGFFFARDLHARLRVPVGLVNSSWGGSPIEPWMSASALASDPAFAVVAERWQKIVETYPERQAAYETALAAWNAEADAAKAKGEKFGKSKPHPPQGPGSMGTPGGLFNGMINPLAPYALRGVLWYQGEANTGRAEEYRALFSALITSWRGHFGQPDLPFLWVQLANYTDVRDPTGMRWAYLREAQNQTLALPGTGQAVTIDIGTPDNIHPQNKQEVGRRLALIARARAYGTPVDYTGPIFFEAVREGKTMRVKFSNAGSAITAREKPLSSFEIAGADKKFFPATAVIDRDTIVVSAPEVKEPVAVRYAWSNAPEANLYNGAGLPASPFRSDNW